MSKSLMSLMFGPNHDVDKALQLVQSANDIDDFEPLDVQNALVGCGVDRRKKFSLLLPALVELDVDNKFVDTSLMSAVESNNLSLVQRLLPVVEATDCDHITGCLDSVEPYEDENDMDGNHDVVPDEQLPARLLKERAIQQQILTLVLQKHAASDEELLDALENTFHERRPDLFKILYGYVAHCAPEMQRYGQLYRSAWEEFEAPAKIVKDHAVLNKEMAPTIASAPVAKPFKM